MDVKSSKESSGKQQFSGKATLGAANYSNMNFISLSFIGQLSCWQFTSNCVKSSHLDYLQLYSKNISIGHQKPTQIKPSVHEKRTSTSFILLHLRTMKHDLVIFTVGMQSPYMPVQQGSQEIL